MTTTLTLTARDSRALAIVNAGGRLVTALRRNWKGHEQQAYWLEDDNGERVSGYGFATFRALVDAGLVDRDSRVHFGSTCCRVYIAKAAA